MATDILCFAEKMVDGKWRLAEPLVPNEFWDEEYPEEPRMVPQPLFDPINYALFAILANVRNPIRSVEPFAVIAYPRDIPPDVSPAIRVHYDWYASFSEDVESDIELHGYNPAAHHASWLLASEIMEFDWEQMIVRCDFVPEAAANLFYPGRIGFPDDEWDKVVPPGAWDVLEQDRVEVTWVETYREAVGPELFEKTLPKLATYGPPDKVRIVFWFNS